MYFTQNDYRKIESWLQLKGLKDSNMDSTNILNLDDLIVLVLKSNTLYKNRKIKISDFISLLWKSSMLVKDIITTSMILSQVVTPDKLSLEVYEILGNNITIKDPDLYDVKIYIDNEGDIYAESDTNTVYMDDEGNIYIESLN